MIEIVVVCHIPLLADRYNKLLNYSKFIISFSEGLDIEVGGDRMVDLINDDSVHLKTVVFA